MKFNGRFKNGKFIPDSSVETKWRSFLARLEREDMIVSIDVKKAERVSDSQLGLFHIMVNMIVEQTGSNEEQVLMYLMRLRDVKKSFEFFNTLEMKNFIDKCIIESNEEFGLNIHLEHLPNGRAKISVC